MTNIQLEFERVNKIPVVNALLKELEKAESCGNNEGWISVDELEECLMREGRHA